MQVSVRYQDFGVRVIDLLDNSRDGIIELRGDQVPTLAGNDLQSALRVDAGQNRVFHTVELNGLF